ncbi:MAG: hypothetical protein BV457_00735 [Thermoplasmata archaeon M9B1D]|nr:MAG: hypothetical protein BV456_09840 [Thermoplasmata archaeon M8B2D]PNX49703.1 MAG: hypothetical protein BV457_00735 [Thermoplasmata archaeon M9B1D]
MPGGDGTGPWWTQRRGWRCWLQSSGFRFGQQRRYLRRYPIDEPEILTRAEQKRVLQDELNSINKEKHELEKRIHELESGKEDA